MWLCLFTSLISVFLMVALLLKVFPCVADLPLPLCLQDNRRDKSVRSCDHHNIGRDNRGQSIILQVGIMSGWASHTEHKQQRQQLSLNHREA